MLPSSIPCILDGSTTPIMTVLHPYVLNDQVFEDRADRTIFPKEKTSYEWNCFLNGAPFLRPQDATNDYTKGLVESIFGGRETTPVIGDAGAYHGSTSDSIDRNALFFDGRVAQTKLHGSSGLFGF
jgi:prepilin-type processing-associated H-X9-DG protein